MINYIRADLYRIFKDKKFIMTLALYVAMFMGLIYMGKKNFQESMDLVGFTNILIRMSFLYIGMLVFYLVYGMDLKAKTSHQALGRGMKRRSLILAKLLVLIIMLAFMFAGLILTVYLGSVFLGVGLDKPSFKLLGYNVLTEFMKTLIYFSISSILVFKSENPITAMSGYVLLASGIIGSLINIILSSSTVIDLIGDQSGLLLGSLSNSFLQGLMTGSVGAKTLAVGLGYLVVSNLLAMILYRKNELEF